MRVFLSYHRADTKYKNKLENILADKDIDYYVVSENADFNGWSHQEIAEYITKYMSNCTVTLCIIGQETYTRAHVDYEIHETLKGKLCERKGLVGIMLENRGDSKNDINYEIFPQRISDNEEYTVLEQWSTIEKRVVDAIDLAQQSRCNNYIHVNNKRALMPFRKRKYYDN